MSLAVVCFWWYDPQSKWRNSFWYTAQHVITLRNMVARQLSVPHRFVCVTDQPELLPPDIATVPVDRSLLTASERYAKLMVFRPDAAELFGAERLLMLDLDIVITGSIDHLVQHDNEFMAWHNPRFKTQPSRRSRFNSSLVYVRAATRSHVYTSFDIERSRRHVRSLGVSGTDQAWMSETVSPDEAGWDQTDGIYSYKLDLLSRGSLPANARVVIFHGEISPHMPQLQKSHPWIREHYQ